MVHYKLTYFPARGRVETARQLFALAGVDHEFEAIGFDKWPEFKQKTPFGQMPLLEEDGKILAQSSAINRHLARKFGYAGKTPWEEAQVDALDDQMKDYFNEIKPYWVVMEKLFEEVGKPARDKFCNILKKCLAKSGSGFLIGDSLTWIDLAVAEHLDIFAHKVPGVFTDFPEIVAHIEKVHTVPAIAEWLKKRPNYPM